MFTSDSSSVACRGNVMTIDSSRCMMCVLSRTDHNLEALVIIINVYIAQFNQLICSNGPFQEYNIRKQ